MNSSRKRLGAYLLALSCLFLGLRHSIAHNGSLVVTSPVSNIVTDGDLSDWPEDLPVYPLAMNLYGDPLVNSADCQGSFQIGLDAETKCLHLAIKVIDDSYVEAGPGHASWDTHDSCTAFVGLPHHFSDQRPGDTGLVRLPVPVRRLKRTKDGYVVELRYDLTLSGMQNFAVPRTAAFSVTLNDKDADGSFTALFWSPEISKNIHVDRRGDLVINALPTGRLVGRTTTTSHHDVGTLLVDFEAVENPLLVFRLRTKAGGTYKIDLPVGTYRRSVRGAETAEVTVQAGRTNNDNILIENQKFLVRSLADFELTTAGTPGHHEQLSKEVGSNYYEMTTLNGLPESRITSLAQDKMGSLWIGTESSIARFDGTQLQVFSTELVDDVNDLHFDEATERLWFAGEQQVGYLKRGKLTTLPMLDGQLATCVGKTHNGQICIGTRNGLFLWDESRLRFQSTLHGLPHRFVTAVAADDRREATWIGTQYGLVLFDGVNYRLFDHTTGLGDPRIISLHVAQDGILWVGTNSSLYKFDADDQFQLVRKHPTERVRYARSFAEAADGTMYIAAFDGELKITPDGKLETLQQELCEAVILDGDSQLWLGLENGALRRTDLGLQLARAGTCSLVQSVGQDLWFVSEAEGTDWDRQRSHVVRFDKDTFASETFDLTSAVAASDDQTHPVFITELHVADGIAWVGTKYHGVYRLKDGVWQKHDLPHTSVFEVMAIVRDPLQRVWIATSRHLYCVEDGKTRLVKIPGCPLEADIQRLAASSSGDLAIGTLMGVFVLNSNGDLVVHHHEHENLASNMTTALMYGRDDTLWVGTLAGLQQLANGNVLNKWKATDGLLKNHVAWFIRRWGDEVWTGSVAGVNRVSTKRNIVQHLVGADGLGQGNVYSVAPDGQQIWLAGESGLWIYRRGLRKPYVVLDEVSTDELVKLDGNGISVTTDTKSVDFRFHAVSLKNRLDGTIYRYRLNGADGSSGRWNEGTRNSVTIDVPQQVGIYHFEVLAYDRDMLPSIVVRQELIVGLPWVRIATQNGLVVAVCSCLALGLLYFRRVKREKLYLESRVADRTRELWDEIRHREIAESERSELQGQLQHMQKMDALGTLATGVAHDFNNSLLAISGNAELALMSDCCLEKDALLEELLTVTNQAAGLTNSMLMFGGKASSEKQAIDICQAIRDAEKILRRTLPATIDFQSRVCAEPLYCDADQSQIQQVILNLAVNARDAMPGGGKITMSVEHADDTVRIHFADSGPGMTAATLDRIFEPFYTEKPRGKGTGLGLSIVHGIIKDHGGVVVAQSKLGEGTEFKIALPLSEARRPETFTPSRKLVRGSGRILLADDDETVRKALSRLLMSAGFDVHTVQDGHQLVERFRQDRPYELLIVDVDMPQKDGWQALQEIRLSEDSEIAAIVISGLPTHECLQDANTLFVRKPFSLQDLTEHAARLLQESA